MATKVKKPKHDNRIKGPKGDHDRTKGVIIHTTEGGTSPGAGDRHGVIDYLANVRNLSVPVVCDDEGSTQMVPDGFHGEHTGCINGCYGIEQCGTARWNSKDWKKHDDTVRHAAEWAAWWLATDMKVAVTSSHLKKLVKGHGDCDAFGNCCSDHYDPGSHYPWDRFRQHAMDYAKVQKFRMIATKNDRKIVRTAVGGHLQHLHAFARRLRKRGFNIIYRRVSNTND